jgi:poly(A) polymerase
LSDFREGGLTVRALGRLVRAARPELPGLFALAMADSLAGQGAAKPADSETVLAGLADAAYRFLVDRLQAREGRPRLLNGHDLIGLGLKPGPKFRRILTAVEEAQWEGAVKSREEALNLARALAASDRQD